MTLRDTYPGELRAADVGREVRLCGWVATVPRPRRRHLHRPARPLRPDAGGLRPRATPRRRTTVARRMRARVRHRRVAASSRRARRTWRTPSCRPARSRSASDDVEVLNKAKTPPFALDDEPASVDEDAPPASYRYLDLRRAACSDNLRAAPPDRPGDPRRTSTTAGFIEVETPILTKSTPEGARDYLVPSRA